MLCNLKHTHKSCSSQNSHLLQAKQGVGEVQ
jgi:hypothetical protein